MEAKSKRYTLIGLLVLSSIVILLASMDIYGINLSTLGFAFAKASLFIVFAWVVNHTLLAELSTVHELKKKNVAYAIYMGFIYLAIGLQIASA